MSETTKGVRVLIDEKNNSLLMDKMKEIRLESGVVNPSKFVNAVLGIFFEKYYEKHKPSLQKIMFDRKKYMRKLLRRSLTEEELRDELLRLSKGAI
ncbi:MAG: hypothetical protein H6623_01665 [Bdellovibrionaceae bacterium]|nr:hypothetical protein [Pseudobdellovibrionaceae bacterium]